MTIVICPGVHPPELTGCFLAGVGDRLSSALVFPAHKAPPYSGLHLLHFLETSLHRSGDRPSLTLIAFSAGVVGAIVAAHLWQWQGGTITALIALDGWGVPLYCSFPIHRVSHDAFTHWSSTLLGAGQDGFYADPPCEHLALWRSPQTLRGWRVSAQSSPPSATTLACFLQELLDQYEPSSDSGS
ncbi:MAG TPA: hypothetical protein IGS37_12580 [Synechococcales cyanobacterium M55_K2018_004]|nr:hypothetical protein [Synechococcales cyanobacterium M55_K2018_004]